MMNEQNQNVDKYDIPVWRKYTLSVQEAAKYFHIGDKKLRKLIDENPDAEFILWNGSRPQIKRRVFEQYVDEKLSAIYKRQIHKRFGVKFMLLYVYHSLALFYDS